jgi:glycosyltransferase involved in cell wall biosynthesis
MKILYDHQAFSLQRAGGITRYFIELMGRLSRMGAVEPVALLGFSETRSLRSVLGSETRAVLWNASCFPPGLITYATNEVLLNALALASGKFDIYHNTLYRFMPLVRAQRRVATHHDCIQERFPELFRDSERIVRAKRRMFQQADLIFCVSESSRSDLEEFYGVGPDRTKVVYNGVSELKRTLKGVRELTEIIDGEFILYVGRRDAYKNFSGLAKAMQLSGVYRTHKLLCIGGGKLAPQEKELIAETGLLKVVRVVPNASSDLLAECYASASLLVYPSLYEGFGLPPLEAMQMKCPTLVARSSATSEICRDGAFFFDPYLIEEFSEMLRFSLFDSSARTAVIKRGLDVFKRYSWDQTAAEVLIGYRGLL